MMYFSGILCFSILTNYNFSQHNILLFFICNIVLHVLTLYGHPQVSFPLHSYPDCVPYTAHCLHIGKMFMRMYAPIVCC
jgi:hypothetical protein